MCFKGIDHIFIGRFALVLRIVVSRRRGGSWLYSFFVRGAKIVSGIGFAVEAAMSPPG